MERTITLEDIKARHARLLQTREEEQKAFEQRDTGYMFVLGELELMIKELEAQPEEAPAGDGGEQVEPDPAPEESPVDE